MGKPLPLEQTVEATPQGPTYHKLILQMKNDPPRGLFGYGMRRPTICEIYTVLSEMTKTVEALTGSPVIDSCGDALYGGWFELFQPEQWQEELIKEVAYPGERKESRGQKFDVPFDGLERLALYSKTGGFQILRSIYKLETSDHQVEIKGDLLMSGTSIQGLVPTFSIFLEPSLCQGDEARSRALVDQEQSGIWCDEIFKVAKTAEKYFDKVKMYKQEQGSSVTKEEGW